MKHRRLARRMSWRPCSSRRRSGGRSGTRMRKSPSSRSCLPAWRSATAITLAWRRQHITCAPCKSVCRLDAAFRVLPWDLQCMTTRRRSWYIQVAAELDKAAYEEGRPAIHKLQMLADVDRVSFSTFSFCASSPCEWCAPAAAAPALSVVIHAGWLAHWQTSWVSRCQGASLSALCVSVMRHNTTLLLPSYRTWCSETCTTSSWTEACWASSGD